MNAQGKQYKKKIKKAVIIHQAGAKSAGKVRIKAAKRDPKKKKKGNTIMG